MEERSSPALLIGACGWLHEAWTPAFYPEDLPPEWRLTYYANEFRVVLVPAGYWELSDQQPEQWVEDTDEQFRFVCEVDPQAAEAALWVQRLGRLGGRCAGALITAAAPARLAALLQALGPRYPLSLETAREASPASLPQGGDPGRCWSGPPESPRLDRGSLALTRLRQAPQDLRALRAVIETCLTARARPAVLILDGAPPALERLRQAVTIRDLL